MINLNVWAHWNDKLKARAIHYLRYCEDEDEAINAILSDSEFRRHPNYLELYNELRKQKSKGRDPVAVILEFQRHLDLQEKIGKLKEIAVSPDGTIYNRKTGEVLSVVKYPFDKWTKDYFIEKGYKIILPMKASPNIPVRLGEEPGVIQHKLDGVSTRCYITKKGLRFFGPNIVKVTGWVGEYSDKIPHLRDIQLPKFAGTILDGEIVHPSGEMPDRKAPAILNPNTHYETAWKKQIEDGWLIYIAYDVIRYRRVDVSHLPYEKRLELLYKVMQDENGLPHHECFLPIISVPVNGITIEGIRFTQKSYHEYIISHNMEGTIFCRFGKGTEYVPGTRSKAKIKFKLRNTFDCVIMGYEPPTKEVDFSKAKTDPTEWKYWIDERGFNLPVGNHYSKYLKGKATPVTKFYYYGWIGSVIFGVYDGDKLVEVGRCSGMDENVRQALSNPADKVLKRFGGAKRLIGKAVIEVEGVRYANDITLRHPQFVRFRPDKDPKECTLEAHLVVGGSEHGEED